MRFLSAAKSIKGLRDVQQDDYHYRIIGNKAISAVTDGNCGDGGKELAEAMSNEIPKQCHKLSQGKHKNIKSEEQLKAFGIEVLNRAAKHVMKLKKSHKDWSEAGTTATLIIITQGMLGCFWIGDSCAYVFDGELTKLTSPVHTLAEEMIKNGEPKDIIERQPSLNSILTRCVGHESCTPDSKIVKLDKPSVIVVCSDGVSGYLTEKELCQIIENNFFTYYELQDLSDEIVKRSFDNGSDDNITVITSFVMPPKKTKKATQRKTRLLCEYSY